ncbi:DUF6090 family protein [Geojedonia litorea]|uniref:DUF6090 family protein n=1 Tax=Geojedonia litorea TaxID=1268269 RepID=A0ABV9N0K0_9FLAO
MEKNKTGKYLKYAIGEIILVVIGIIIALQINTWNGEKKDRTYELKMLSEVKSALKDDLKYIEFMVERTNSIDSMVNVISEQIINKSIFVDSLYLNEDGNWYVLQNGTGFRYNSGPYEALKSSGIDKIANDSLRQKLINLYDHEFPLTEIIVTKYNDEYSSQMKTLKSLSDYTTVSKNQDQYVYNKKYPKDLFQNQDFIKLMNEFQYRAKITLSNFEYTIPQIRDMIDQIENELKNK